MNVLEEPGRILHHQCIFEHFKMSERSVVDTHPAWWRARSPTHIYRSSPGRRSPPSPGTLRRQGETGLDALQFLSLGNKTVVTASDIISFTSLFCFSIETPGFLFCTDVYVCAVPWCKLMQANVSLSLLGKFSVSLLEMQQSPGVKTGNTHHNKHDSHKIPGTHAHIYTLMHTLYPVCSGRCCPCRCDPAPIGSLRGCRCDCSCDLDPENRGAFFNSSIQHSSVSQNVV